MTWFKYAALAFLCAFTGACTGVPKGITPVAGFEADRYLGKWYEIARYDHGFERDLSHVTATYSRRSDGGIRVINQGYNFKKGEWETAEGKAYFVGPQNIGHLKVSFFGPFYGSYVVFALDEAYTQSYVTGPDRDYLWYLSRTPTVTEAQKADFVQTIQSQGYNPDALIWVAQNREEIK